MQALSLGRREKGSDIQLDSWHQKSCTPDAVNLHKSTLARTWLAVEPKQRGNARSMPFCIDWVLQKPLTGSFESLFLHLLMMKFIWLFRQPAEDADALAFY